MYTWVTEHILLYNNKEVRKNQVVCDSRVSSKVQNLFFCGPETGVNAAFFFALS